MAGTDETIFTTQQGRLDDVVESVNRIQITGNLTLFLQKLKVVLNERATIKKFEFGDIIESVNEADAISKFSFFFEDTVKYYYGDFLREDEQLKLCCLWSFIIFDYFFKAAQQKNPGFEKLNLVAPSQDAVEMVTTTVTDDGEPILRIKMEFEDDNAQMEEMRNHLVRVLFYLFLASPNVDEQGSITYRKGEGDIYSEQPKTAEGILDILLQKMEEGQPKAFEIIIMGYMGIFYEYDRSSDGINITFEISSVKQKNIKVWLQQVESQQPLQLPQQQLLQLDEAARESTDANRQSAAVEPVTSVEEKAGEMGITEIIQNWAESLSGDQAYPNLMVKNAIDDYADEMNLTTGYLGKSLLTMDPASKEFDLHCKYLANKIALVELQIIDKNVNSVSEIVIDANETPVIWFLWFKQSTPFKEPSEEDCISRNHEFKNDKFRSDLQKQEKLLDNAALTARYLLKYIKGEEEDTQKIQTIIFEYTEDFNDLTAETQKKHYIFEFIKITVASFLKMRTYRANLEELANHAENMTFSESTLERIASASSENTKKPAMFKAPTNTLLVNSVYASNCLESENASFEDDVRFNPKTFRTSLEVYGRSIKDRFQRSITALATTASKDIYLPYLKLSGAQMVADAIFTVRMNRNKNYGLDFWELEPKLAKNKAEIEIITKTEAEGVQIWDLTEISERGFGEWFQSLSDDLKRKASELIRLNVLRVFLDDANNFILARAKILDNDFKSPPTDTKLLRDHYKKVKTAEINRKNTITENIDKKRKEQIEKMNVGTDRKRQLRLEQTAKYGALMKEKEDERADKRRKLDKKLGGYFFGGKMQDMREAVRMLIW